MTDRLARQQARQERAATGAAFAVEATERRRVERISRPRTSAAYVVAALGAALVFGAVTALVSAPTAAMFAGAIGLFAAALVLALAMILAGALRRRSGFLAFATVLVLVCGTIAAVAPPVVAESAMRDISISNLNDNAPLVQREGNLSVDVDVTGFEPSPITVAKGEGDTLIQVFEGAAVDLRGTFGTTDVHLQRLELSTGELTDEIIPPDAVDAKYALPDVPLHTLQTIHLTQGSGTVTIRLMDGSPESTPSASPSAMTPSPTPSPTLFPTPEVTP
jgi:hypothetical protein